MRERLRRGGVRSRNIIVDITNYVMLELGQPMHAFDRAKLAGGIVVRRASGGEELDLLDGSTVKLSAENLVIADHEKAVALAGIMGGQHTAIAGATRDIFLESAFFPAPTILGKARQFGMHTDASHRFERGADPALQARAIERASALVMAFAGGEAGAVSDVRHQKTLRQYQTGARVIAFQRAEIKRNLGVAVPDATVNRLLDDLGLAAATQSGGWRVRVPGWRSDLAGAHDLVEEVGRIYGFDRIPARPPLATVTPTAHRETAIGVGAVRQKLVERGYFEAVTYAFVAADNQRALTGGDGIALRNPIADNMAVMRRSLLPGLLDALKTNRNRQHERVRLFEVGHVFLGGEGGGCGDMVLLPATIPVLTTRRQRHGNHGSVADDAGDGEGGGNHGSVADDAGDSGEGGGNHGSVADDTGNNTGNHREINRIAAVATGSVMPTQWGETPRGVDFYDLKGDLLALLELSAEPRIRRRRAPGITPRSQRANPRRRRRRRRHRATPSGAPKTLRIGRAGAGI